MSECKEQTSLSFMRLQRGDVAREGALVPRFVPCPPHAPSPYGWAASNQGAAPLEGLDELLLPWALDLAQTEQFLLSQSHCTQAEDIFSQLQQSPGPHSGSALLVGLVASALSGRCNPEASVLHAKKKKKTGFATVLEDWEGPFFFLAWGGQVDSEEGDETRRGLLAPSSPLLSHSPRAVLLFLDTGT